MQRKGFVILRGRVEGATFVSSKQGPAGELVDNPLHLELEDGEPVAVSESNFYRTHAEAVAALNAQKLTPA